MPATKKPGAGDKSVSTENHVDKVKKINHNIPKPDPVESVPKDSGEYFVSQKDVEDMKQKTSVTIPTPNLLECVSKYGKDALQSPMDPLAGAKPMSKVREINFNIPKPEVLDSLCKEHEENAKGQLKSIMKILASIESNPDLNRFGKDIDDFEFELSKKTMKGMEPGIFAKMNTGKTIDIKSLIPQAKPSPLTDIVKHFLMSGSKMTGIKGPDMIRFPPYKTFSALNSQLFANLAKAANSTFNSLMQTKVPFRGGDDCKLGDVLQEVGFNFNRRDVVPKVMNIFRGQVRKILLKLLRK